MTIGMVLVACLTANGARVLDVAMTSTSSRTGHGIFAAIMAVWERLEGRVGVRPEEEEEGQEKVEYRTIEDVAMFLQERGIDALRVPPPPPLAVHRSRSGDA